MKKVISPIALSILLAVGTAGTAFAWAGGDGAAAAAPSEGRAAEVTERARAPRSMGRMAGRLGLTAAQRTTIRSLVRESKVTQRGERERRATLSPEARRADRMAARGRLRAAIFASLTEAQKAQLSAIRSERSGRRAQGVSGASERGHAHRPDRGRALSEAPEHSQDQARGPRPSTARGNRPTQARGLGRGPGPAATAE